MSGSLRLRRYDPFGEPIVLHGDPTNRPPNIILVTLDTTRVDVAGDPTIAPTLAELGARGFKAKNIRADHLRALIERAHHHGLTVTGHLDSGYRNLELEDDRRSIMRLHFSLRSAG